MVVGRYSFFTTEAQRGLAPFSPCLCGCVRVGFASGSLFGQVDLNAHLFDLVVLSLQPIQMIFFILEDRSEHLPGSVVLFFDRQANPGIIGRYRGFYPAGFALPGLLGHLLENLVFTALRCLHSAIYYYKTKSGREVDFIIPLRGRPRMLVQVCESLAERQSRKRETAALKEAMVELGLKTGTIVTRNEEERIDAGGRTIEVVPAWRYLLELPESEC